MNQFLSEVSDAKLMWWAVLLRYFTDAGVRELHLLEKLVGDGFRRVDFLRSCPSIRATFSSDVMGDEPRLSAQVDSKCPSHTQSAEQAQASRASADAYHIVNVVW